MNSTSDHAQSHQRGTPRSWTQQGIALNPISAVHRVHELN
jgi:hypothetical protein